MTRHRLPPRPRAELPAGQREPFGDREQPQQSLPYSPERQLDVAENARYRGALKPGTVKIDVEVLSVYDSRPINGRDFLVSTPAGGLPLDVTLPAPYDILSFTAPAGYVAVVREVSWLLEVISGAGSIPLGAFQWRAAIDGRIPAGCAINDNSPFQTALGSARMFEIVDESDVFTWQLLPFVVNPVFVYFAHFKAYGNLLLKRSLPPNFEIAHEGRATREVQKVL